METGQRGLLDSERELADQWKTATITSLSASLMFGRESATEISRPYLSELFKLVHNDFDKAAQIISEINDFPIKRLLLSQFRHCYIISSGDNFLSPLLNPDFENKETAKLYDQALLKVLNDCNNEEDKLAKRLKSLPLVKRRVAQKRLGHSDFKENRKISVAGRRRSIGETSNLFKWWHWALIIIAVAAITMTK